MIYFDNAATTKPFDEVIELINKVNRNLYGNPSSVHSLGAKAKAELENARNEIASLLNCKNDEIFFTSGATESINWVIKGLDLPVVTSKIDHKASLNACSSVEKLGRTVSYLEVDSNGLLDLKMLDDLIRDEKYLVSIIYANNETGVIQDISKIIEISRKNKSLIHLDAVQALGKLDIDLSKLDVDFMSFSGHKIHGPKGIGLLYKKNTISLKKLIDGGKQENNYRAGTENLAGIIGFSKAMELSLSNLDKNKEIKKLRDYLENSLLERITDIKINSFDANRLPNISNFSIKAVDSSMLLMMLDLKGICVSAGSACTAGAIEKSHVLSSMGINQDYINGSIRVSLDYFNQKKEVDIFINELERIVEKIRK